MLKKIDAILANAGDREAFFNRISQFFPTRDPRYLLIKRGYDICKDAFRGMKREDETRVFEHLRGVALIQLDYLFIRDPVIIFEGLTHDLGEDKKEWPIPRIEEEVSAFRGKVEGVENIPCDLEYINKPSLDEFPSKELCLKVYHGRLAVAPRRVLLSKLPDRFFNVRTLGACSKEKRQRKIEETELIYLPLARRELILAHEIEVAMAEIKWD